MVAAVERHLPGAQVQGIAAGLHVNVLLAEPLDVRRFEAACEERSVRVYGSRRRMICLGYANVPSRRSIRASGCWRRPREPRRQANPADPALGKRRLGDAVRA